MKIFGKHGIPLIEVLLVLVIIGLIGFTGWFAWHAKQNTDASLTNTAKSQPATPKKVTADTEVTETPAVKDETTDWYVYSPEDKSYAVSLADGWSVYNSYDGNGFNTFDVAALKPVPGVRAVVKAYPGGKDGTTGFFFNHPTQNIEQIYTPGTKQIALTTKDGLEIEKYYYVGKEVGIGSDVDITQYTYIIRKTAKDVISSSYAFDAKTMDDYHETVEKVLQTVHFK